MLLSFFLEHFKLFLCCHIASGAIKEKSSRQQLRVKLFIYCHRNRTIYMLPVKNNAILQYQHSGRSKNPFFTNTMTSYNISYPRVASHTDLNLYGILFKCSKVNNLTLFRIKSYRNHNNYKEALGRTKRQTITKKS